MIYSQSDHDRAVSLGCGGILAILATIIVAVLVVLAWYFAP